MNHLPFLPHGDALFGNAALVVGDKGIGGVHNGLGGAVVPFQAKHLGPREILLEIEDVLDLGTAEAIDGLGVVPHHANVPVTGSQFFEDDVLGHVGILVLIHQNVAEAAGNGLQGLRTAFKEDIQVQEDIVKIHDAGLAAQLAVAGIDAVDFRLLVVVVVFPETAHTVHIGRGGYKVVFGLGDATEHLLGLVHFVVQFQLLDAGFDGAHGIRGVVNGKGGREADNASVLPQETDKDGVEGAHPDFPRLPFPYHKGDAFLHLPRRLFSKGKRENPLRRNPFLNQICNSGSQYPGFPRTCTSDNQHRPLDTFNGLLLLRIQIPQNLTHIDLYL